MRVVRVLIDGRPNTRLSRTMYGRSEDDLVVPHQKAAGDSITTRVRYHGMAHGAATVGANARGDRVFLATAENDGGRFWLPVPRESGFERVTASFRIQTLVAERSIAPGVLEKVDTLPYGHAVWRYRMDTSVPLSSLAVASGPYGVRVLTPGRCGDGCPMVEHWSYAGGSSERPGLSRAWEMVEWFAARAGRYPYARLAFVEAPVRAPVAAPGMVLIPEGAASGGADSTLALATARQWFGLAVSPAAAEDRWVVDGLARYLASLWRDPTGRATDAPGPASDDRRGARAMRALRGTVGDSVFFAGLSALHRRSRPPDREPRGLRAGDVGRRGTGPRPGDRAGVRTCALSGAGWPPRDSSRRARADFFRCAGSSRWGAIRWSSSWVATGRAISTP